VGVSLILLNGAAVVFGNDYYSVHTAYQTSTVGLGGLRLSVPSLISFGWAVAMVVALQAFLFYTDAGRALRATAQNRDAAVLMGINPRRMFMMAFGIGVGLTAIAGAVILPYTTVTPQSGQQYVVIMFTVMVLGGLTSIRGALAGGLVVGVVQSVSTVFLPTSLQNLVVFLVFLAALAVTRSDRTRPAWPMRILRLRSVAVRHP
jgi:branched-chain amino acid transport system permease protein